MSKDKENDPDRLMKKADKITTLSFTRWSADWEKATPMYEKAATLFKLAKNFDKAKICFTKAAVGQKRTDNTWAGAKHMETAAGLAREQKNWVEVQDLYRQAYDMYMECSRPQPAAEALARSAKAIENDLPDEAVKLYLESVDIMEEEGKENLANETYRAAANVLIKHQRYEDAANIMVRWGLACDKAKAAQSQAKCYLSAVIIYLYAQDLGKAELCLSDCEQIEYFPSSDQGRTAHQLVKAYHDQNADDVKFVVKDSHAIRNLDHMIVRLAKQLPVGDMGALKASANKALGIKDEDEGGLGLEEGDLT